MRNSCLYKNKPKTFRRSSTAIFPLKNRKNTGWGTNLQNQEKSIREMYVADGIEFTPVIEEKLSHFLETGDLAHFTDEELEKIRIFLQRDQAGAEALIVAFDSRAGDYRSLFQNNIKVHVYVALKLFLEYWYPKAKETGLSLTKDDIEELSKTDIPKLKLNPNWKDLNFLIKQSDNWSQDERYYFLSKKIVHAYNNGLYSPSSLRHYILEGSNGTVVIPEDDSIRFIKYYGALFPELSERADFYRTLVQKNHMIYNLLGHPYIITNDNPTEKSYRDYQTWPQQSTVGEITRIAYCEMYEYIQEKKKRWDILADTHDSFLLQSPLMDIKDMVSRSEVAMNIEMTSFIDGTKFRMKSEWNIGFNWGPKKPDGSNKLGLQEVKWI